MEGKMDLGAYVQIEELDKIVNTNGIRIPRVRGYRLMKDEEPVSKSDIEQMMKECEIYVVEKLCEAKPFWSVNPERWEISTYTDYVKNYFLIKNKNRDYIGIRWNRIHGWKRKLLKFAIKKQKRRIQEQYALWNKYAGQDNVLYIHSRMGGNNWKNYAEKENLIRKTWFLDRVDDCFDSTYCDFYANLKY